MYFFNRCRYHSTFIFLIIMKKLTINKGIGSKVQLGELVYPFTRYLLYTYALSALISLSFFELFNYIELSFILFCVLCATTTLLLTQWSRKYGSTRWAKKRSYNKLPNFIVSKKPLNQILSYNSLKREKKQNK